MPFFTSFSNTTAVVSEDANVSFTCDASGEYRIEVIAPSTTTTEITPWTAYTLDTSTSATIPNANMEDGDNTVRIYCKDEATNVQTKDLTINKQPAAPDMTGVVTLADNDSDLAGLD